MIGIVFFTLVEPPRRSGRRPGALGLRPQDHAASVEKRDPLLAEKLLRFPGDEQAHADTCKPRNRAITLPFPASLHNLPIGGGRPPDAQRRRVGWGMIRTKRESQCPTRLPRSSRGRRTSPDGEGYPRLAIAYREPHVPIARPYDQGNDSMIRVTNA